MFRTADGAGVQKIYCVGYTPAPKDRFGRVQPEIAKTSLGANDTVSWEHRTDIVTLITELQAQGVMVVAVEQSNLSVPYYQFSPTKKTAYLMGNEIDGVPMEVQKLCDAVIAVPMSGQKESLNVATCAGIVLFHHRDYS